MNLRPLWSIPALPFNFRPLSSPENPDGIPNHLPFHLAVQESTGRVAQIPDPIVAAALEAAYRCGSALPGMMENHGIGREYADDFLIALRDMVRRPIAGLRVLEIGCGTGYLLQRLQAEGAEVTGIEPGHQAGQEASGVKIVRGFFPAAAPDGQFDLILMYGLLEHLPDPADLLRKVIARLAPGGLVILAVPDATEFLERGDVSLLFSEHYSYFTADSLQRTVADAGGGAIRVQRSPFSALLYASCSTGPASQGLAVTEAENAVTMSFRRKAGDFLSKFQRQLDASRAGGKVAGIYAPGRAVNPLALNGMTAERLRFFDDSALLHGTYFPGIPVVVESRQDFERQPPDEVLIMSASFGARIESALRPLVPASVQFRRVESLCA